MFYMFKMNQAWKSLRSLNKAKTQNNKRRPACRWMSIRAVLFQVYHYKSSVCLTGQP